MKRRQAIAYTAALIGGTLVGTNFLLSGCKPEERTNGLFTEGDILLLDEIGETILPATPSSPGAKEAQIGAFMALMVADCYDEKEQAIFTAGLKEVEKRSKAKFSKVFMKLTPAQRLDLLNGFDAEAQKTAENALPHFFTLMKDLTKQGYFSSEPGVNLALRYNPVPGRFDGCVDYVAGERAWY
jgi:hypothetical protein